MPVQNESYRNQFQRIMRMYQRMINANNGDDYKDFVFAFFQMAHSLKDWIKNDALVTSIDIENRLNDEFYFKICADIANRTKHYKLTNIRANADIKNIIGNSDIETSVTVRDSNKQKKQRETHVNTNSSLDSYDSIIVIGDDNEEYTTSEVATEIIELWKSIIENFSDE